jgi:hypothetical protein
MRLAVASIIALPERYWIQAVRDLCKVAVESGVEGVVPTRGEAHIYPLRHDEKGYWVSEEHDDE